jgi:hypothetical protein
MRHDTLIVIGLILAAACGAVVGMLLVWTGLV